MQAHFAFESCGVKGKVFVTVLRMWTRCLPIIHFVAIVMLDEAESEV